MVRQVQCGAGFVRQVQCGAKWLDRCSVVLNS